MLARVDGWLTKGAGRFVPGFIRHMDRRSLTRHPLLWRSRLLPVLWFALPAVALSLAAGYAVPMTPSNAWTETQIANAVSYIELVVLIIIAFWARIQLGYAVGELSVARHLQAAALNFTVITVLLLIPQAFHVGLSYRIARVMPVAEFQSHWDYHRRWDFWCCSSTITDRSVAEEKDRLSASLERFGMGTSYRIKEMRFCPASSLRCLEMYPRNEIDPHLIQVNNPRLLGDRLKSIAAQQAATAEGGPWDVAARIAAGITERADIAAGLAAVLVFLSVPRYVWFRRWLAVDPSGSRRRLRFRPWLPPFLRRLDRRWLLHRPMFWATRAHVFLCYVLIVSVTLSLAMLILSRRLTSLRDFPEFIEKSLGEVFSVYAMGGILTFGSILWAITCRGYHIPASSLAELRKMIGSFFIANLPPAILLGGAFLAMGAKGLVLDEFGILVWFVMVFVGLVVSGALVANYAGRTDVMITLGTGIPLLFGPVFLVDLFELRDLEGAQILALVVISWLIVERAIVNRANTRLSAGSSTGRASLMILVGATPAVVVSASASLVFAVGVMGIAGSEGYWLAGFGFLFTIAVFWWEVPRMLQVLARAQYIPRVN